ncbi:DegT/DnrJ/EryC1/StrS family aminotransferase [Halobaculum litoreum]|uniref:DegT/DnrJ/EryC1/StrS family aminotransferase n=1 Tax=Halobaculum litoreum TaxID=3031998 RepID=A0ABD5XQZ8_9EURY|nr:DegT/DnrJ/EryC1/StrS family aminotransferase [Halobaculum sp. DT92]
MTDIPLFEINWDREDILNVVDSVGRGSHWAKGPYVDEFESRLESYLGVEHALVVNSGTTALVAALEGAGIGEGDEVIVPAFTFIATANAVRLVGAEPVFADIETETYGLDPDDVRNRISEDTAAVLPVHCYGTSCRISALNDVADEHDLVVIEDAAEALGATHRGQHLGTLGDVGALSFCQNKIISTGEGGAVVTDDDDIAETVRLYRSHGRASANYFDSADSGEYVSVGTNIRMADINAALGCAQLDRIDDIIERRRAAATRMSEAFADVEGVEPHKPAVDNTHVYQLFTVTLDPLIDRSAVVEGLADRKVASKVYWDPAVHRTEVYDGDSTPDLPVTEDVAGRVLSLPIHPDLSSEETTRIVDAVAATVGEAWETGP